MAIQKNNQEVAYTLIKSLETDEIHIFEGTFITDNCNAKKKSICEKLDRKEDIVVIFKKCLDEDEARQVAAQEGRSVCGICVSNLYASF